MKPTKRIEAEVLDVYQKWLHSYLNGDVATYNSYFDDAFHFIGSTNNEEFLTRKDTTNFFKVTAEQLAGKTQLRNETKIVEQFGELVFITHLFDAWFLNGNDWSFYGRFRFSNILEQNKNGWHFVYQHYSTPDSKAQDGETIGYNQITKENLELREAIQRGTIELESRNRELEIEGALARIRAQAVAMQQSTDLLDIVVTMRNEFTKLGHEAHYFWHMMWLPETYEKAMTSGDGSKIGFVMNLPRHIHGDIPLLAKWEKSKKPTVVYAMDADEAIDYVDKMVNLGNFQSIDPQAPSHDDIRHIGGLTFIMARTTHGEIGYSLPGVVKNTPEENLDILVQFAGAFDLAHQRFLDLQKAEKQAREVQIELALEKVRSRTMAMQRSEELADVSSVLFQQVKELGIEQWTCGFNIWETGDTEFKYFPGGPDGKMLPSCMVPLMEHPVFREFVESRKRGDDLMVYEKEGDIQKDHYKYMLSLPGIGDMLQGVLDQGMEFPDFQIDHIANFAYGNIVFITYQPVPEMHDVFKRFAKVFEQTYTRFLDLQKAEAQAKEAQIEAALERVRSRSMAMHNSDELKDVIKVIFDQMGQLKINADHAGIVVDYEPKKDFHFWVADHQDIPAMISVPYLDLPWDRQFTEAKKKGTDFFITQLDFEEKNSFYKKLLPYIKDLTKQAKDFYLNCPGLAASTVIQKDIGLYIENFSALPFSDAENSILMRFGKVFQQTYTRFLDLQKAEAQTREAQIEAALEKVRSRTMAMQKGEEVRDVGVLLYKELIALGVTNFVSCGYVEINEKTQLQSTWVTSLGGDSLGLFYLPLTGDVHFDARYKAWKKQQTVFHQTVAGQERRKHLEYAITTFNSKEAEEMVLNQFPDPTVFYCFNFSHGYLHLVAGSQLTKEEEALLARFTKVFEQTYARFLDLEKAAAQTREAQINLAVERVRAKALAMHKSEEIMEVVAKLKEEVMALDIPDVIAATIFLNEGDNKVRMWDLSTLEKDNNGYQIPFDITFKLKKRDPNLYVKRVWENPKNYFIEIQEGKDFKRIIAWLRENNKEEIADEVKAHTETKKLERLHHAVKKLNNGKLVIDLLNPPSDEMETILTKMGGAFDLAYKRFQDLQKAEAQTREAQIETALERVRSRSMAMHNSEELLEVITVVSEQLQELDFKFVHVSFANNDNSEEYKFWTAAKGLSKPMRFTTPYLDIAVFNNLRASQEKSDSFCTDVITKKEHNKWHSHLLKHGGSKVFSKEENDFIMSRGMARSTAINPNIMLILANYASIPYSEDENKIIERFGQVFEQSYTRFLDLQKAETQTREAQIEAALEKVRSRSLAMHKPDELQEVVAVVAEKLKDLGVIFDAGGVILCTYFPDNKDVVHWIAVDDFSTSGRYFVPYFDNPIFSEAWDSKNRGDTYFSKEFSVKAKNDFFKQAFEKSDYCQMPNDYKQFVLQADSHNLSAAWSKNSAIIIPSLTGAVPSESDAKIMIRFAKVFEQAYIRFMDLQKSEAQAREAQIEAALERVRSRAMAMRNSDDIGEATTILFEEIEKLEIETMRCGILIIHENVVMDVWTTSTTKDDKIISVSGQIDMKIHPLLKNVYRGWKAKEEHTEYELIGKDGEKYYKALSKEVTYQLPTSSIIKDRHYCTCFLFNEGALFAFTKNKISLSAMNIFRRFAKVFGLTYQRYRELIESEKREKEAKKQSSLDRVRGEIASMRSTEDLNRITPIIWQELTNLGVPFFRCGIFIMNEENENIQVYLSDPNGKSLSVMNLDFTTSDLTKNSVKAWRNNTVFKAHWSKEEFINWTKSLMGLGKIETTKGYQGGDGAPESLDLHFVPFSQGMLYVGNLKALTEDQLKLVKNLSESFSIAYSRYEDFAKLEKAKQSVETTLTELKATQNQLVQSEKMASLGELTAGIAHEIQNPLNFVNNFSEVSKELLQEMQEEIENGDFEEVKAIMNDVIQNLEKINHHGKRADGIVKGMLQHSRSSKGTQEPTDINVLADEYLRLAYHGLRAKDKSFNAELITDFDETIGKISVIPQDMGRVILNLITNAFYASNERKQNIKNQAFKPTVCVRTKKVKDTVQISVKDNGMGIPKEIVDKIFQPFFTTKPTGQGTGLGLSMSYDIVTKGHGGELKLETEENEGTTFSVVLPIAGNSN